MIAALAGCAALAGRQAADTEKLLAAAGFQRVAADSVDSANLYTAPREIVPSQSGKLAYTYADPDGCRCIYVGGPEAYAKYRELARSEAIAADMSLGAPNSASTNGPAWAAWDPRWAPTDAWDDPHPALTDF